jgi:hypothetical protein
MISLFRYVARPPELFNWIAAVVMIVGSVRADVALLPAAEPPSVFGGEVSEFRILFRNSTDHIVETVLQTRLFQLSSATAMPIGAAEPWRRLTILPRQTIVEKLTLKLPAVRAETRFEVCWINVADTVVGRMQVIAYPTNLLGELTIIPAGKSLGVFDPDARLKPLLKRVAVEFNDLEKTGFETFEGRLAIVVMSDAPQMTPEIKGRIADLHENGVGIVWIAPSSHTSMLPRSSIAFVNSRNRARLVMASPQTVQDLEHNPLSQLSLLLLAQTAVRTNAVLNQFDLSSDL